MGGGGPVAADEWKHGNVNELTDFDNRDPISGFPVFKALLCDVQPREDEPNSRGRSKVPGLRVEVPCSRAAHQRRRSVAKSTIQACLNDVSILGESDDS